ncbi:Osw2p KNAG_0L00340 [Huiozyma naganishii CBS 8797]|uniref:Ketopantoate reductase C-terminal domain-containing protein n=1 Tax=Huiozyma naganishii (strain ATCC MYA-139 / BCRC 22969 / CBS 8797 / KCTC 17520 / NBRC 10181 / NCYC 3082 / Yp74L-3) TaxID=1071383 RepID=J7S3J2_HUIN7|nr:hypothetical protein KNAG_0L00340 [Kazachstania naganishii CBS 8797]CCK72657.1 hypothetical protein KNAG_0L00340 [Kazachstania naganishii CBS 8797]
MEQKKPLTCLIIGETPSTQFLGWRLSLSNTFVLLTSQYVSVDGLVAWKSTKLGANFYTPNIFTKDLNELGEKLLVTSPEGVTKCKYDIDIIVVSAISIERFEDYCTDLVSFSNKNTIVLVSSDFGCELEPFALKVFGDSCKCVLSILCEVECRQLSLGSYALVNDDHCCIYLGVSYSSKTYSHNQKMIVNANYVNTSLFDNNTSMAKFVNFLQMTKWISIQEMSQESSMALKIWECLIPKIALNILTVIYEQFDYDILLETKNTETIFQDLVKELFTICKAQCHQVVPVFCRTDDVTGDQIDFDKIVTYNKKKKRELINTTANEHPEYLSLPFEPYCFFHKFEYPAHILLYQPIVLANRYKVECSNVNFLFGFYSRLLSLSGLSINGGHHKRPTSLTIESNFHSLETEVKMSDVREEHHDNFDTSTGEVVGGNGVDLNLPSDLKKLYLTAENMGQTSQGEGSKLNKGEEKQDRPLCDFKQDPELPKDSKVSLLNSLLEFNCNDFNDTSIVKIHRARSQGRFAHNLDSSLVPYFNKQTPSKRSNDAVQAFEAQLRRHYHEQLATEYRSLYTQLMHPDSPTQLELNDLKRQHLSIESQLWRMNRRFNEFQGTVARPLRNRAYEDLLRHVEILNRANAGDVLMFTTSRYGEADTYQRLKQDEEKILELFKKR